VNGVAEAIAGWGTEPSILIFADREHDRAAAAAAARGIGARVIGAEPVADALDRLGRQANVDTVYIELCDGPAGSYDRLLDWTDQATRDGAAAAVLSMPHSLIDEVWARVEGPGITLLCDAGAEERAAALALALARRRHKVHDRSVEAEAERLRRLSEEVARIAGALADLSDSARSAGYLPQGAPPDADGEAEIDADSVRNLIRIRRLRDQFFARELFADPAWDMLLDLMAARLEQSRVAVSSLCIAAAVPATTALRWIRALTEQGLFARRADPADGRRVFIELSDAAADALAAYFRAARQMGLLI
jgi:hypothetical protein